MNNSPRSPMPVDAAAPPFFHLGRHLLAEFYDCNSNVLNNTQLIEDIMVEAAVACGATVVERKFHQFNPFGVSGVVIIAESHLAIHTWPELGYAAVDLFTCGDSCRPTVAYEWLRKAFHAGYASYTELKRGLMDEATRTMVKSPFQVQAHFESKPVPPSAFAEVEPLATRGEA